MKSRIFCWFILLILFFAGFSYKQIAYADSPTTIYTPRGSVVPDVYNRNEFGSSTIADINNQFDINYPNATRLSDASATYNCHGYAWHVSEGGSNVWIGYNYSGSEEIYWTDGSYDEVTESVATKVSYSGDHSATTTGTPYVYISKWGSFPLAEHNKDYVPSGYGYANQFFRRSVDVPEDFQSINSAISNSASGQTSIVSSGDYTLSGNIAVPSGVTLTLDSGADVDFNGYYIDPGAGNFNIQNSSTVYLIDGSSRYRGLFTSIQTACNTAGSGHLIELQPTTFNESFSLSSKSSVNISGNGALINGDVALNNSSNCSIDGLHLSDEGMISVSGGTGNYINSSQVDRASGALNVYGATTCEIYGFTATSGDGQDFAVSFSNSTGDVSNGSTIENYSCGVYAGSSSSVNVTYNSFCNNGYDVDASGGGYAYVMHNTYSRINPVSLYGNYTYIAENPEVACGSRMMAKTVSNTQGQKDVAALKDDEVNQAYLSLIHKISKDELKESKALINKYKPEYDKLIAELKGRLDKNLSASEIKNTVSLLSHCYKWLNEKAAFYALTDQMSGSTRFSQAVPYLKSYSVSRLIDLQDYKGAIETADAVLKASANDQDLTCQMFYEKGIIYKFFLDDKASANRSFAAIVDNYPENELSRFAKGQLSNLPNSPEDSYLKSTGLNSGEFRCSNYPNPFNPVTRFTFSIPQDGYTELKIYNSLGQEIKTLVSEDLTSGQYSFEWNASSYSSGIYFYTLKCGSFITTNKLIIMK